MMRRAKYHNNYEKSSNTSVAYKDHRFLDFSLYLGPYELVGIGLLIHITYYLNQELGPKILINFKLYEFKYKLNKAISISYDLAKQVSYCECRF